MPHIPIPEGVAGIRGPMLFRPETARHLNDLVEVLLRGPHTLTSAERELIAAFVSARNECKFCHTIHGAIAGKVQVSGRNVTTDDVARARNAGATDIEIHDAVLIAAVFSLCNRYVDGLATWAPDDPDFYRARAAIVAANGYHVSTATPSPSPQV